MSQPAINPAHQGDRRHLLDRVYREILWHLPMGVTVVKIENPLDIGSARIVSANPAALRMKDFTIDEVIGKSVREVLPALLPTISPDEAAEAIRSGLPRDLGYVRGVRHPERTYAVKAFRLAFDYVGVVFEDVTQERASVEAEERFWKALQAAPFAICILKSRDGEILEVNERFCDLFGVSRGEQILGKRASDLGIWNGPGEFQRVVTDLQERREIREAPISGRKSDGHTVRALAALQLIGYGGENCILSLFWRA